MSNIASDNPFSETQTAALATLAAMLIPASDKYGVPGADDPVILADIIASARANAELFAQGLSAVNEKARAAGVESFAALPPEERMSMVQPPPEPLALFVRSVAGLIVQCYYRDDRVKASLGIRSGPPFPEGYELEQGDWTLLDPVRNRGPIWRKTT